MQCQGSDWNCKTISCIISLAPTLGCLILRHFPWSHVYRVVIVVPKHVGLSILRELVPMISKHSHQGGHNISLTLDFVNLQYFQYCPCPAGPPDSKEVNM